MTLAAESLWHRDGDLSGDGHSNLSIVVCTHRRPESVRRFVAGCAGQPPSAHLVIVDASPDDQTERVLTECTEALRHVATRLTYCRVRPADRGLTRQRNLALQLVTTELVAFFDDDVVLRDGCLDALCALHRRPGVAGVGTFSARHVAAPSALWRWRRRLGIVSSLAPGRYSRSGMSTPWGWQFLEAGGTAAHGDWLPGYAMSWKSAAARSEGFDEVCGGYGQGEDLEFSLRMRRYGDLLMSARPLVDHFEEPAGRPRHFTLGYMAIHNRFRIHRRALAQRRWSDVAWFVYAWSLDTVFLLRGLTRPGGAGATLQQVAGRASAAMDLVTGRRAA